MDKFIYFGIVLVTCKLLVTHGLNAFGGFDVVVRFKFVHYFKQLILVALLVMRVQGECVHINTCTLHIYSVRVLS